MRVESPPHTGLLAVGDPVPTFRAITHDGRHIDVSASPRERVLVVYFYPRNETGG